MKGRQWISLGAVALFALGVGWWAGRQSAPAESSAGSPGAATQKAEPRILYYRNPMGLPDTSPVPKKDSMGMDYVPVYEGGAPTTPGTVLLPPEKVQKLGVRTAVARLERLPSMVRASATVQVDETRQFVIAPRFEGWIERLHVNQTGMAVRRGQALMTLYSPALQAAQEEYRIADRAARRLADDDPAGAASMRQLRDAAQARLRNWQVTGAPPASGSDAARLVLTAPADAVVIEKSVVEGDRFEPGQTILRLADLSTVWIVAQVPAAQASELSMGQPAHFSSSSLPGQTLEGTIDFIHPVIDQESRTVPVRLVFPNSKGELRPGLYGEVVLEGSAGNEAVTVPRSAVIDSGLRRIILVQMAPGHFEPRQADLGRPVGDRVSVLKGVAEGEEVVVSANFLIDAESNLTSALQGLAPDRDSASAHEHQSRETNTGDPESDGPHGDHGREH